MDDRTRARSYDRSATRYSVRDCAKVNTHVLGLLLLFFLLSGLLFFFFLRVVGVSTVKTSGSACVGGA